MRLHAVVEKINSYVNDSVGGMHTALYLLESKEAKAMKRASKLSIKSSMHENNFDTDISSEEDELFMYDSQVGDKETALFANLIKNIDKENSNFTEQPNENNQSSSSLSSALIDARHSKYSVHEKLSRAGFVGIVARTGEKISISKNAYLDKRYDPVFDSHGLLEESSEKSSASQFSTGLSPNRAERGSVRQVLVHELLAGPIRDGKGNIIAVLHVINRSVNNKKDDVNNIDSRISNNAKEENIGAGFKQNEQEIFEELLQVVGPSIARCLYVNELMYGWLERY